MMTDPEFLRRAYGTTDGLQIRIRAQELYGTGASSIFDELTAWALTQTRGDSVLDIGMGTGKWYQSVRSLSGPAVHYTGLDASAAMVATMEQATLHDTRTTLCQGDAQHLPFPDHSFDWVGLHYMLYHVPHPKVALAEASRVTKPGGLIMTLAHGTTSLQALLTLHAAAVAKCLARAIDFPVHTYTLDTGAREFPDFLQVKVERRPSGLRFPDVHSALSYYGSGFWQRGLTDGEVHDPGVRDCLFREMESAIGMHIDEVGYFDMPGQSGWLWARKP